MAICRSLDTPNGESKTKKHPSFRDIFYAQVIAYKHIKAKDSRVTDGNLFNFDTSLLPQRVVSQVELKRNVFTRERRERLNKSGLGSW